MTSAVTSNLATTSSHAQLISSIYTRSHAIRTQPDNVTDETLFFTRVACTSSIIAQADRQRREWRCAVVYRPIKEDLRSAGLAITDNSSTHSSANLSLPHHVTTSHALCMHENVRSCRRIPPIVSEGNFPLNL